MCLQQIRKYICGWLVFSFSEHQFKKQFVNELQISLSFLNNAVFLTVNSLAALRLFLSQQSLKENEAKTFLMENADELGAK